MKKDILSLTLEELKREEFFSSLPRFRAEQVYLWLHKQGVSSFEKMNNLPKTLITSLEETYEIRGVNLLERLVSSVDGTVKYLFSLCDGELVETVLLRSDRGLSVCVSSEVGCKMGCVFCASAKLGFKRKLSAGEMLSQVYYAAFDSGERISSVMLMGIGEPLDNYENVMRFIDLLSDENGKNLSERHISLSTCGIVPEIKRLAEEKRQLTLSISLHSPFEETRSEMMPINKKYNIKELKEALDYYLLKTGRRISVEYAVIEGENDSDSAAKELKKLFGSGLYHINLIPLNEIKEKPYKTAAPAVAHRFKEKLLKLGLNATVRRRLGADIEAACGQLRREYNKEG